MTSLSESLFAEWSKSETIIRSALDGTMGETVEEGESAAAILGDFAFFAGVPNKKLILVTLSEREFLIAVPQNEAWGESEKSDKVCVPKGHRVRQGISLPTFGVCPPWLPGSAHR